MSDVRDLQKKLIAVKAEQGRLTDELTVIMTALAGYLKRWQALSSSKEEYIEKLTASTQRTNKALRTYIAMLDTILDQLEAEEEESNGG